MKIEFKYLNGQTSSSRTIEKIRVAPLLRTKMRIKFVLRFVSERIEFEHLSTTRVLKTVFNETYIKFIFSKLIPRTNKFHSTRSTYFSHVECPRVDDFSSVQGIGEIHVHFFKLDILSKTKKFYSYFARRIVANSETPCIQSDSRGYWTFNCKGDFETVLRVFAPFPICMHAHTCNTWRRKEEKWRAMWRVFVQHVTRRAVQRELNRISEGGKRTEPLAS